MMRSALSLLLCVFGAGLLSACGDGTTDPSQTGSLKISLTDAPAAFEAVNITFSEISAHIDDQWVTVRGEPITVNLLEWNNGQTLVLGTAEVPAGRYTQIRLKITEAEVVVNGQTHAATVPSGTQTGLKLVAEFTVNPGSTYELIIDFDAQRSIATLGPPNNPIGYILKPSVRVVPRAITGSISGTITNAQNMPVAYAVVEDDTVTSTAVDESSGGFMLAFLPEGNYTVTVRDTAGFSFTRSGIAVIAGSNQDLGTITLE